MHDREIHRWFIDTLNSKKGIQENRKIKRKKIKRCKVCGQLGDVPCRVCLTRNAIKIGDVNKEQLFFDFYGFSDIIEIDVVKCEIQLFGKDMERYKQIRKLRAYIDKMAKLQTDKK